MLSSLYLQSYKQSIAQLYYLRDQSGEMAGPEGNLCEATRSGSLEQVKQLVEQGAQANQLDKHGETPLIIASCLGYTEVSFHIFLSNSLHISHSRLSQSSWVYLTYPSTHEPPRAGRPLLRLLTRVTTAS